MGSVAGRGVAITGSEAGGGAAVDGGDAGGGETSPSVAAALGGVPTST